MPPTLSLAPAINGVTQMPNMPNLQGGDASMLSGPAQQSSLQVSPTSAFDSDTQNKLQHALKLGQPYQDALSSAEQYQSQKDHAVGAASNVPDPTTAAYGTNTGGGFKDTATKNLPTLLSIAGGVGGALLAPETGGLSLALPALLAGAGGGLGSAASNQIQGKPEDIKADLGQAALGAGSEFGGQLLGKAVKGIGGAIGDWLTQKGESVGIGSLGIGKGGSSQFGAKMNEPLATYMARTGQPGADAAAVQDTTHAMQAEYDALARNSGVQVPVSDISGHVQDAIDPLKNGVSSQSRATGQAVEDEYHQALQNMGVDINDPNATLDIGKLADAKSTYQGQVHFNSPQHEQTMNGALAEAFMNATNAAADKAGLLSSDGTQGLSEIGQDLRKQYFLNQLAQKSANTSMPSKVINTGGIIRSGVGGALPGFIAGGPVGAAVGAVAEPLIESAVNNPKVLGMLAKTLPKAGDVVSNLTAKAGGALSSPLAVAALQGGGITAANAALNPSPASSPTSADLPSLTSMDSTTPSSTSTVPQTPSLQAPAQTISRDQYNRAINIDMQRTGGSNIAQLSSMFNAQNPQLNSDVSSGLVNAATASKNVDQLTAAFNQAGGGQGGILGGVDSFIGAHSFGLAGQGAQSYNSLASSMGTDLASKIYGGGATDAQVNQVTKAIPQLSDSAEVANQKIKFLKGLIAARSQAYQAAPLTSGDAGGYLQNQGVSLNLGQ